jgi:uncharacterized damage-inducible protein DinB
MFDSHSQVKMEKRDSAMDDIHADQSLPLATYYRGWDRYQQLLTTAVAPLSAEQLELRAAPTLRPIWVIAAHIIAARVLWFHRVMGEGSDDLAALQAWDDDGEPERSAAELERGLERTWELSEDCLQRWTAKDFEQEFTHPRRGALTRQWVIWHVLEHDLHHGGELALTLGMHGLSAPDL